MSFLKLSIVPNVKPSQPKIENVREFMAEIKKCTMTDIVNQVLISSKGDFKCYGSGKGKTYIITWDIQL